MLALIKNWFVKERLEVDHVVSDFWAVIDKLDGIIFERQILIEKNTTQITRLQNETDAHVAAKTKAQTVMSKFKELLGEL